MPVVYRPDGSIDDELPLWCDALMWWLGVVTVVIGCAAGLGLIGAFIMALGNAPQLRKTSDMAYESTLLPFASHGRRLIREALRYAIEKREAEEKQMQYNSPSAMLDAWRGLEKALRP